jgi:hypothetical protein
MDVYRSHGNRPVTTHEHKSAFAEQTSSCVEARAQAGQRAGKAGHD